MPPRTTPAVIDRRVLPTGEIEEWERCSTIPDDFIYDPERHCYYPPGEGSFYDVEAELREIAKLREERLREPPIPKEQLIVPPGVLYTPESRRKALRKEERDLFSDLPGEDEVPEKQQQAEVEPD